MATYPLKNAQTRDRIQLVSTQIIADFINKSAEVTCMVTEIARVTSGVLTPTKDLSFVEKCKFSVSFLEKI